MSKKLIEKQNKYNELIENELKLILLKIKNKESLDIILKKIAEDRNKIENVLISQFTEVSLDNHKDKDKFGVVRTDDLTKYGIKYNYSHIKNYNVFFPYGYMAKKLEFEGSLITPLSGKYKSYEIKLKSKCTKQLDYSNHIMFKYLFQSDPLIYVNLYKHITLTKIYYENDDGLYNEIKENIPQHIPPQNLNFNINMYRTIYHTDKKHIQFLINEVNIIYKQIINELDFQKNFLLIKKIYWLLSNTCIYIRGSASITEIFTNSLLLYIQHINNYQSYFYLIKKENVYPDIEAMISSCDNFCIIDFDKYFDKKFINNIEEFYDINIIKIESGEDILINKFKNSIQDLIDEI